jgi:deoxyuridine 5'-triphosphate nucleotidohydrolase
MKIDVISPAQTISVMRIHPEAALPEKQKQGDAGWDLRAIEDSEIFPGGRKVVKTGIQMAIPEGYYGRVAPRSGLAVKKGVDVLAGVVDSNFRGEVGVVLINLDPEESFSVRKGDRVAQIIFEKVDPFEINEVEELPESDRGIGGFGSTGV